MAPDRPDSIEATAPTPAPIPEAGPPRRRRRGAPWAWAAVACVLLGASGAVRAVQDRRHREESNYREACPIDLDRIPTKLGPWQMVEGGEQELDPLTMRITGGTAYKLRTYADKLTGVRLVVLILFGPAEPVLPHVPDICYPSSGYTKVENSPDQVVEFPRGGGEGPGKALFRSAVFQKAGRTTVREAVYHSFRLEGQWSPYIAAGRKFPRRNPGLFKIQVQRQVAEGEVLGKGDPIEQFLGAFLPVIEDDLRAASARTVAAN